MDQSTHFNDISVNVAYSISAEEGPLEAARVVVNVKTAAGTFKRTFRVSQPSGVINVTIPKVAGLPPNSEVSATATITQGGTLTGSGVVPDDLPTAKLSGLAIEGTYQAAEGGNGTFNVTATAQIAESISVDSSGSIELTSPARGPQPFSIPAHATSGTTQFSGLVLKDGDIVSALAQGLANVTGEQTATWTAHLPQAELHSFTMSIERVAKATPTRSAKYDVQGHVSVKAPPNGGTGQWSTSTPSATGNLTFASGESSHSFAMLNAAELTPGAVVNGTFTLNPGGKSQSASVAVPAEPNELTSATLNGIPSKGSDGSQHYQLQLSVIGVVPNGQGASLQISGAYVETSGARLEGKGGQATLNISAPRNFTPGETVTVSVSIENGNELSATWTVPAPNAPDESTGNQPTDESDSDGEGETPPEELETSRTGDAATPPATATIPPDESSEPPAEENDPEAKIPTTVELVSPKDGLIVGDSADLTIRVRNKDGSLAQHAWISWQYEESAHYLYPWLGEQTNAAGELTIKIRPPWDCATFRPGAKFKRTLVFHHYHRRLKEPIEITFAPPLKVTLYKTFFHHEEVTIEYSPSMAQQGGAILLQPKGILTLRASPLAGEAIDREIRGDIPVGNGILCVGNTTEIIPWNDAAQGYPVIFGESAGGGGEVKEFDVQADFYLGQQLYELKKSAEKVEQLPEQRGAFSQKVDALGEELLRVLSEKKIEELRERGQAFYRILTSRREFLEYTLKTADALPLAFDVHRQAHGRVVECMSNLAFELMFFEPVTQAAKAGWRAGVREFRSGGLRSGARAAASEGFEAGTKAVRRLLQTDLIEEAAQAAEQAAAKGRKAAQEAVEELDPKVKQLETELKDITRRETTGKQLEESLKQQVQEASESASSAMASLQQRLSDAHKELKQVLDRLKVKDRFTDKLSEATEPMRGAIEDAIRRANPEAEVLEILKKHRNLCPGLDDLPVREQAKIARETMARRLRQLRNAKGDPSKLVGLAEFPTELRRKVQQFLQPREQLEQVQKQLRDLAENAESLTSKLNETVTKQGLLEAEDAVYKMWLEELEKLKAKLPDLKPDEIESTFQTIKSSLGIEASEESLARIQKEIDIARRRMRGTLAIDMGTELPENTRDLAIQAYRRAVVQSGWESVRTDPLKKVGAQGVQGATEMEQAFQQLINELQARKLPTTAPVGGYSMGGIFDTVSDALDYGFKSVLGAFVWIGKIVYDFVIAIPLIGHVISAVLWILALAIHIVFFLMNFLSDVVKWFFALVEEYATSKKLWINRLQNEAGCAADYFSVSGADSLMTNQLNEILEYVTQDKVATGSKQATQQAQKMRYDRAFDEYEDAHRKMALQVLGQLAPRVLSVVYWPTDTELDQAGLETGKSSRHWQRLQDSTQEMKNYQEAFALAGKQPHFWSGFEKLIDRFFDEKTFTWQDIEYTCDWLCWLIAWSMRLLALLGMVTVPIFGVATLVVADITEVALALLRSMMAGCCTLYKAITFEHDLLTHHMRSYYELVKYDAGPQNQNWEKANEIDERLRGTFGEPWEN